MKVSIIQLNIKWGDTQANINCAERLMGMNDFASDLYVLPEMWSTGFATNPIGIAEDESTNTSLRWMKKTAKEHKIAICGSLAVCVNGSYYNRHYFINGRTDDVKYYDKCHLFRYGKEDVYYTSGKSHQIVEYMGFRFLLLTCYDLRFPVWNRYSERLQYDAIIIVANWPESRQNAWQILTRARAIENQAFLIGCNRVGDDIHCHYCGQSDIISPIGKSLVFGRKNIEEVITGDLDLSTVEQYRMKFRVLDDRDIY